MDSRLIFLHLMISELWGRRTKVRAGKGKPGPARGSELKVVKLMDVLPRKATIAYHQPVP